MRPEPWIRSHHGPCGLDICPPVCYRQAAGGIQAPAKIKEILLHQTCEIRDYSTDFLFSFGDILSFLTYPGVLFFQDLSLTLFRTESQPSPP